MKRRWQRDQPKRGDGIENGCGLQSQKHAARMGYTLDHARPGDHAE